MASCSALTESQKPRPRAWFESLAIPSEHYALDDVRYSDSEGGLLQVVHNMDELAKTFAFSGL